MAYAIQGYLSADHAKADRLSSTESAKLKEACQGFEALFIHKMMQAMRQATMESDLIKKSNAEKIFTDLLDEELSNEASRASVGGIADMLYESMKWAVQDGEKTEISAEAAIAQLDELRKMNRKEIPSEDLLLPLN